MLRSSGENRARSRSVRFSHLDDDGFMKTAEDSEEEAAASKRRRVRWQWCAAADQAEAPRDWRRPAGPNRSRSASDEAALSKYRGHR